MTTTTIITASMIAPCGMNCALCMGYLLREKNKCPGCRGRDAEKPVNCARCRIKHCSHLYSQRAKYCFACDIYPCSRMKQLDKRYRTKYHMSMIENLAMIKESGIREFVKREKVRWRCPRCGGVICVHREVCPECGKRR